MLPLPPILAAFPFALPDVGWLFAAIAVLLAVGLVLGAVTRRREPSSRPHPLRQGSTDP
jgi:hypothetical protein